MYKITSNIRVKITDFLLTPLTCATLLNEIIKSILYQRSQIPYPYNWLNSVIKRKRSSNDTDKIFNITVQKHYQDASNTFDSIEEIMENIFKDFSDEGNVVTELILIFGTTICTPKEIVSFTIPKLANGHDETSHLNYLQRNQHKVLRDIFLSEHWVKVLENHVPITNMFLMLKKHTRSKNSSQFFAPTNYTKPLTVPNVSVDFINDDFDDSCCTNLMVYDDSKQCPNVLSSNTNDVVQLEPTWYQANRVVKGFKDCFLNKRSACEFW